MRRPILALWLCAAVGACGSDDASTGDEAGDTATTGASGATAGPTTTDGPTGGATTPGSTSGVAGSDGTGTGEPPGTGSDDGGPAGFGPVELYRGPVAGGVVPGWDPDAPRPLLMMGRLGTAWVATLASIGDDGSLSENVAEEIIVWGWDVAPPMLYDGPVGGTLSPWSTDAPYPVVLVGHRAADGAWVTTLSSIDAAGTLGDNAADRLIVWGWTAPSADAPVSIYDGPVIGGTIDGWNADDPVPLVMLGRLPATDVWQSTLASIESDGTLGMNIADRIVVWGW